MTGNPSDDSTLDEAMSVPLVDDRLTGIVLAAIAESEDRTPDYIARRVLRDWAAEQARMFEMLGEVLARPRSTKPAHAREQRRLMTPSLRLQVMQRDVFSCKACGSKADRVRLHVDHVVPISKGGATEMANLQTLCADCNLGKAARLVVVGGQS